MAEDQRNYKLCDEIIEEISALSKECRILELELKELTKKDNRSKGYYSKYLLLHLTILWLVLSHRLSLKPKVPMRVA